MLDAARPVATIERIALHAALGRVLAASIASTINVPPHHNSAMDGYALRGADLAGGAPFRLIGASFAGKPFTGAVGSGECVRIMTGAVVPEGADSVVMQEYVTVRDEEIVVAPGQHAGCNIRHPGDDLALGSEVLAAGRRLTPADLGLIASVGSGEVSVLRRPRIAFFSTGDELRAVGQPLAAGQIHDSNRYTLAGMLERLGMEALDLGVCADNRAALRATLTEAATSADAVITSGGVSVGEADYIHELLAELGTVAFWKIAMKPGKPLAFGHIGQALFFGLPGNPVSVMATFYQFVQPTLRRLAGEADCEPVIVRARCAQGLRKQPGRAEFQRGILRQSNEGLEVHTTGVQESHVLSSMSRANCFLLLDADCGDVPAGTWVDVQPFEGLI